MLVLHDIFHHSFFPLLPFLLLLVYILQGFLLVVVIKFVRETFHILNAFLQLRVFNVLEIVDMARVYLGEAEGQN